MDNTELHNTLLSALGTAVERYDLMGAFDEPEGEPLRDEAEEVHTAYKTLSEAMKKA